MSEKLKNLKDLLKLELKDLYSAEEQLLKALPKMADKATSEKLRTAFEDHLEETEMQRERLEQVAKAMNFDISGETCKAMKGLIEEGKEIMKEDAEDEVMDQALIAAAQKVEHYEIASYGTVVHYAEVLGLTKVYDILSETLEEEKKADKKLNKIAKSQQQEESGTLKTKSKATSKRTSKSTV
jgi:ferritin-like metal-binding protein YciE